MDLPGTRPLLLVFLAAALLEALASTIWRGHFDWRESAASLAVAAGQRFGTALGLGLTGTLFEVAWQHRLATLPIDSLAGLGVAFLAVEFAYYWQHRMAHEVRWYWASHAVHHSPNELTLSSAIRLGWTGTLSGAALFYLPLPLCGINPLAVGLLLGLNLTYQFWLHTTWIPRLGPIEWVLNTPSRHRVHHASNAPYLDRNYGGVLIVYDLLFGTAQRELPAVPCRYGLTEPLRTYNPFTIVFHEWSRLVVDVRNAHRLSDKIGFIFKRPGWRPGEGAARAAGALPPTQGSRAMKVKSVALCAMVVAGFGAAGIGIAQTPPDGAGPPEQRQGRLMSRFQAADTNHDGKLTPDEAKAGMPMVYKNFNAIDADKKGYVTLDDIKTYMGERAAQRGQGRGGPGGPGQGGPGQGGPGQGGPGGPGAGPSN